MNIINRTAIHRRRCAVVLHQLRDSSLVICLHWRLPSLPRLLGNLLSNVSRRQSSVNVTCDRFIRFDLGTWISSSWHMQIQDDRHCNHQRLYTLDDVSIRTTFPVHIMKLTKVKNFEQQFQIRNENRLHSTLGLKLAVNSNVTKTIVLSLATNVTEKSKVY